MACVAVLVLASWFVTFWFPAVFRPYNAISTRLFVTAYGPHACMMPAPTAVPPDFLAACLLFRSILQFWSFSAVLAQHCTSGSVYFGFGFVLQFGNRFSS